MIKYFVFDECDAMLLYLSFLKKDMHFFYHHYVDPFEYKVHEFSFSNLYKELAEKICKDLEIQI